MQRTMSRIFWTLGVVVFAGIGQGCAPAPKSVSCSNDGECHALGDRLNYCLESRCVECVGSASCGVDHTCSDGMCVQCVNDASCSLGKRCVEGACADK